MKRISPIPLIFAGVGAFIFAAIDSVTKEAPGYYALGPVGKICVWIMGLILFYVVVFYMIIPAALAIITFFKRKK